MQSWQPGQKFSDDCTKNFLSMSENENKSSKFFSSKYSYGHVAASFDISTEKWPNKFCSMSGKTIDKHNLSKIYVFPQENPMKM